jgi:hypothetical protein
VAESPISSYLHMVVPSAFIHLGLDDAIEAVWVQRQYLRDPNANERWYQRISHFRKLIDASERE